MVVGEWGMMKKKGLRKGLGDRKRGVERNEEEIEHWKRRTRPLKRKCKFRTTPCVVRKFRIPMEYQDREHGFENLSQKRIRTRFPQGSHSCEIRTRDFGKGLRACFLEIGTKAFSHKGCVVRKFRTTGSVVRKSPSLVFFSPVVPLFSPCLHSSSFPT